MSVSKGPPERMTSALCVRWGETPRPKYFLFEREAMRIVRGCRPELATLALKRSGPGLGMPMAKRNRHQEAEMTLVADLHPVAELTVHTHSHRRADLGSGDIQRYPAPLGVSEGPWGRACCQVGLGSQPREPVSRVVVSWLFRRREHRDGRLRTRPGSRRRHLDGFPHQPRMRLVSAIPL